MTTAASRDRPALQQLLADIRNGKVNVIVVYKVDRLTRSLADFAKLVELFDCHGVSFVSVTQQFNTTTSMGRLTLNVLLSFAQFEREVTSERIRGYGIEIDPLYCDVTIRRLRAVCGLEANLEGTDKTFAEAEAERAGSAVANS